MTEPLRLFSISGFLAGCLRTLPGALRASGPRPPAAAHPVPADFLGICVAASDDPAGDDFVLRSLREAGLRDVRLDITYGYETAPAGRLLKRLLADDFKVLLHLVQPFDEARLLPAADALDRWARFTRSVFSAHRGAAVSFEAGSTCNRRKWTGYRTLNDFLLAWRAALTEARAAGVPLAGVNVTDFEPVYNAGLLELLKRHDLLPAVQTDNLFAERATEPEAYDPKILGPRLAGVARFNLVRKALLLAAVGRAFGLETLCTHTAWSERRIRRLLEDADQKQADYLARYLLLAAASGALRRVYWGPLIGQREGLIDDGTQEYPEPIPHVTFYGRAPGDPARYRRRPAFEALRALASFLPGAAWSKALASGPDVTILEFRTARGGVHAAWTRNGRGADLEGLYLPADLEAARLLDRDGRTPRRTPALLTEAPLYLFWDDGRTPLLRKPAALMPDLILAKPLERRHQPVLFAGWRGILGLPADRWPAEPVANRYLPDRLEAAQKDVLRKARNTVWVAADPLDPGRDLVVKRAKAQAWHKRLLSLYQPSKARRSWNSACEMERRGVATPEPVAFFERPVRHAALSFSYYVCRRFDGTDSVRTAFTAFAGGAESFQGMTRSAFYEALVRFLGRMHERGVYHRDLSAGNVLAQVQGDGQMAFSVIDTGRARFFSHPLPERLRLADLKRLCHPLTWPERDAFVSLYLKQLGLAFTGARRLPFRLYDWKHALKKKLRPLRGK